MSGPGESCNQEYALMHTHTHAHTRSDIHGCVCSYTCTLWGTWQVLGPGSEVWGGPGGSWGSSLCLVSVGAAGEEQVCVPDVCLCVPALPSCRARVGGWLGGGDPTAPGPRGQRGQSQKHGWLPTQPERRGGMSDCGGLPVCCTVTSARGGAVLCLAGPRSPRGLASGCRELGREALSLHVATQPHPDGPPPPPPTHQD